MLPPSKVAIVEDDQRTLDQLADLFQGQAAFDVVAIAQDVKTALREIPAQDPDLIVLDIQLGSDSQAGVELITALKAASPTAQIMMLTIVKDTLTMFRCLYAGASEYVVKADLPHGLISAAGRVLRGELPTSQPIARKIQQLLTEPEVIAREIYALTEKESKALALAAEGLVLKEIADQLGIGLSTVKERFANIYAKMHAHSRSEAVGKFLRPR